MKKVLFLLLLIPFITNAHETATVPTVIGKKGGIIADQEECPKNITCPTGELLGDDGQCYKCDDKRKISVLCDTARAGKSCPNRYLSYGEYTTLNESVMYCPEDTIPENGICRNKKCEDFEGFHSTEHGCCPIIEREIKIDNDGNKYEVIHPCVQFIYVS